MKFGICVMPDVRETAFYARAEQLGYDSVWVTDSQMLYSDCYAALALAATTTTRIRLGPGVAVAPTRIAPVQAAAIATINRLAPGRVFLSVGTGNTAMRSMGAKPMLIKDFREYLRTLRGLIDGDTVSATIQGQERALKILMHDTEYMDLEPRIPLYVSGFGPRSMGLAGEFGDGLVYALPPRGLEPRDALKATNLPPERLADFRSCALANIVIVDPGEPLTSDRIIEQIGPNVMATVYYFYDYVHERGVDPPDFLKPIWKRYCDLVEQVPAEHRHHRTHEFHYTRLHPHEAELITEEMIRATCIAGTADEVLEQVRDWAAQGLEEVMWATGTAEKWPMMERFARDIIQRI